MVQRSDLDSPSSLSDWSVRQSSFAIGMYFFLRQYQPVSAQNISFPMDGQTVVIRLSAGHPALQKIDPSTSFLYAPHTVSALVIGEQGTPPAVDHMLNYGQAYTALGCPPSCTKFHSATVHAGLALLAYYGDVLGGSGGAAATGIQSNAAAGIWAAILVFLGEQQALEHIPA